jgi:hypothetical protein
MALRILPPIAAATVNRPELRYRWDDTRASADFVRPAPEGLVDTLRPLFLRARIALAIGMYEWVIERFRGLHADPLPFNLAEGAWCANVHRAYMEYLELTRSEWTGPIRGPIWCAATWLLPAIYFSDDEPEEWESGIDYLAKLALHVLPDPQPFDDWLNATVDRLVVLYTAPPPDPFEDLFGEREEARRGPLIAREALDPAFPYRTEDAERLIRILVANADPHTNDLLRTPEEMVEAGFTGVPYAV